MQPITPDITLAELKQESPEMYALAFALIQRVSEFPSLMKGAGLEGTLENLERMYDDGRLLLFWGNDCALYTFMVWSDERQHYFPFGLAGRPFIFGFDGYKVSVLNFDDFGEDRPEREQENQP